MTLRRGLHVADENGEGADAIEARLALAGLFAATGVLTGGAVTGTSAWTYSVGPVVVASSRAASDGVVVFANDTAAIIGTTGEGDTIPPAPGTGSRIDIIYALHRDVDNGDADSLPVFGVASGVASGSPVAPVIPTGAVEIARATLAAGATNTAHANVTISTGAAPRARLLGADRAMYAVKGIGDRNLGNAVYDWLGTTEAWTLIGPASPPPQFTYAVNAGTTLGQGLQAVVPGLFRLSSSLQFPSDSTGYRFLRIVKNGTIIKKIGGPAASAGRHVLNIDATAYLAPGDRLGVQAYQDSGASMILYNGEDSRSIVMEYLGP